MQSNFKKYGGKFTKFKGNSRWKCTKFKGNSRGKCSKENKGGDPQSSQGKMQ